MMRRVQILAVLLIAGLLLAACGGTGGGPTGGSGASQSSEPVGSGGGAGGAGDAPRHGGTLTVALSEQPATLNPYGPMSDRKTIMHIAEPLVALDPNTLEIRPLLAVEWEIPDELTYIFRLREGVKFHDGTPFNAEAVKFVFEYMLDPEVGSPRSSDFDRIESVEVIDEYTVAFHLTEPFGAFLSVLNRQGFILSPESLRTMSEEELDVRPVGTGPFKVVEWVRDDRIVLERFDEYWDGDLPYLDRLVYRMMPDHNSKMLALRAGDVDMVDNVPAAEIQAIQADPNFNFASAPSTGYRSIYLNTAKPPFDNVLVRQALAWAIDREALIRLGAMGFGQPAYGPLAPPQWAFNPDFKPHERNPERVAQLLEAAGVGSGFSFTMLVSNTPEDIRMAEVLQEQFAEVGITVEMVTGEYTALRTRAIEGDYEAFYVGWLGGADPDYNTYNSFHSNGWFNWVHYSSPRVDELLDQARGSSDVALRTELYREAQRIIAEEAPMIFIKFPYGTADGQAFNQRVKGFVPDPLQDMHFRAVWVDPK